MGVTMGLNLILLLTMVATNILSLYHLSTIIQSPQSPTSQPFPMNPIPDNLIRQLQTIRAAISHHMHHHPSPSTSTDTTTTTTDNNNNKPTIPSDLLLYAQLSPIASSCQNNADLLHKDMTYSPFSLCPQDSDLAETLILHGCHPLPRRRCFSRTPSKTSNSLPLNPFPSSSLILW
ncbi:hypothetical protein HS088_TW14G00441 [Tripterygium wilfordii]|uniref:Uncharacterized protein n=1 Tax=Tripterygium wilfordii TaxID=458696 RepID=A0A7J7CQG4_TRIWF|nr:hypothetical protein HS088_TW14G00441 [Tripterygium wilfordii]